VLAGDCCKQTLHLSCMSTVGGLCWRLPRIGAISSANGLSRTSR
jgi:hypothetical protein